MPEVTIGSRLYYKKRCTKDAVVTAISDDSYVIDGLRGVTQIKKYMVGAPADDAPFCLWSDWFTYGQEMQKQWLRKRGLIPN